MRTAAKKKERQKRERERNERRRVYSASIDSAGVMVDVKCPHCGREHKVRMRSKPVIKLRIRCDNCIRNGVGINGFD